ncbi:MAG: hypothetical protein H6559_01210 [Lewinellaceae bacterium]|nr:hypothetical protein [Lewinellaceae bacterium]
MIRIQYAAISHVEHARIATKIYPAQRDGHKGTKSALNLVRIWCFSVFVASFRHVCTLYEKFLFDTNCDFFSLPVETTAPEEKSTPARRSASGWPARRGCARAAGQASRMLRYTQKMPHLSHWKSKASHPYCKKVKNSKSNEPPWPNGTPGCRSCRQA